MIGFQFGESAPQRLGLVGADALDEVHQRGLPPAGILGLGQRVHHEAGDEFVAAVHGAYRCARSSRIWETRFFLASRCSTVMIVV